MSTSEERDTAVQAAVGGLPAADAEVRILDALSSWDGNPESGHAIRRSVRDLPSVQNKAESPAVQPIRAARSAYGKRKPLGMERLNSHAPILDVFVGDPEMGPWPFHAPDRIPEEEAILWLRWMSDPARRLLPDAAMLEFVEVMFRTRRRVTWLEASRALAALARCHAPSRAVLTGLWTRWFPEGLPRDWAAWERARQQKSKPGRTQEIRPAVDPPTQEEAARRATVDEQNSVHMVRHVLHLACAWLANGGDPGAVPGMDASQLSTRPLPEDGSTASVVLTGLSEFFAAGASRHLVVDGLAARARETQPDLQAEEALREIADRLLQGGGRNPAEQASLEAILERLTRPAWLEVRRTRQWDALWSWLLVARWLRDRGQVAWLQRMEQQAGPAAAALALKLHGTLPEGGGDPVEAAISRLRILLDPDVWHTTPEVRQSVTVVEAWQLFQDPAVEDLPWDRLVARALGRQAERRWVDSGGQPRKVREVWHGELALALCSKDAAIVLRDMEFGDEVALDLAASSNDAVLIQSAVQVERLLRNRQTGADRIRFLWHLLLRDPHQKLFRELRTIIRWNAGPLFRLVEAFRDMDAVRDRKRPEDKVLMGAELEEVGGLYRRIAEAADGVLEHRDDPGVKAGGDDLNPHDCLPRIADDLTTMARLRPAAGTEAWFSGLRNILFGPEGRSGLKGWMTWLQVPLENAEAVFEDVVSAFRSVAAGRPHQSEDEVRRLADALANLDTLRNGLAWPEAAILAGAIRDAQVALDSYRRENDLAAMAAATVRHAQERGDAAAMDAAVAPMAGDPMGRTMAEFLKVADLVNVHRFLLEKGHYAQADQLKALVGQRAVLQDSRAFQGALRAADLRKLIEQGDENGVLALLPAPEAEEAERTRFLGAGPEAVVACHRFLLARLNFRAANALRAVARGKVAHLESTLRYLSPLLVGALAGPVFILDMGQAWSDSFVRGEWWFQAPLLVATFLLAFGLLWVLLSPQAIRPKDADGIAPPEFRRGPTRLKAAVPVLRVFLLTWGVSLASSCFTLLSLRNSDMMKQVEGWGIPVVVLFWSFLSVFLGAFVQIVLQRQTATRRV